MFPSTVTAGDTFSHTEALADYLASDGWVLHHRLIPRAGASAPIQIDCSTASDGDAHLAEASASATAAWESGTYTVTSWVTLNNAAHTVATSSVIIKPDPRQAVAGLDARTDAQIALEHARIALRDWDPTRKRYQIGQRQMEFNSPADIIRVIQHWESEVRREAAAAAIAAGLRANKRRFAVRLGRG